MNEDLDIDASAIGGVGEGLVATWALQVGITPNRVERDKHGWDYSMEFPRGHSRHGTVSLDLVPCEIRCFVQVKTITSRESRVQIALSNWNRMAKDPTPWFIVVVVLDEKLAADAAFLVHVDRVWVGRVLKRLRELPEASSLHDRYLELTWDDSQRFPNLHGTSLRDGIRFHVGSDLNAYVAEKKTWIETVGYEESRHQVQMSFSASSEDEMWEMLADAAVGLRRELPIKTFRAEELRFDLPKEVAASEEDGGTVEFLPREPETSTRITLERADGRDRVSLAFDTYRAASVVPWLPEKFRLARFVSPFCTAVMRVDRNGAPEGYAQLSFAWQFHSPEPDANVTLRDLGRVAHAALLLHESRVSPIRLTVRDREGEGFTRTDIRSGAGINSRSFRYWATVRRIEEVARHFQIDGETVFAASIIDAQAEAIDTLAAAFAGPIDRARFSGAMDLDEVPVSEKAVMLVTPYLVLGEHVVGACLALVGTPTWSTVQGSTRRIEVVNAAVHIVREFHVLSDEWSPSMVDELVVRARAEYEVEGKVLVMFPEGEPDEEADTALPAG